ncbi:hypothetical protein GCM10027589_09900 [Actinocorallia lasiicapitis]
MSGWAGAGEPVSADQRAALVRWGRRQAGVVWAWWGQETGTLWVLRADALWFWDGSREPDGRLKLRKAS